MPSLTLTPVELISSQRTAAKNGPPSSLDYNDTTRECLADLTQLASAINDQIRPILLTLNASAANGLDGSGILASLSSDNANFRDANGNLLTIADVLLGVLSQIDSVSRKISNQSAQLTQLNGRLASTYQNDLRTSLQGLSESVRSMQSTIASLSASVVTVSTSQASVQAVSVTSDIIPAASTLDVVVTFPSAFADINYVAIPTIDNGAGVLSVLSWIKTSNATITVKVGNSDSASHTARIGVIARSL